MKLYFLFLLLVMIFMLRFITVFKTHSTYSNGQEVAFTARLHAEPEKKGTVQTFSLSPKESDPLYIRVPLFPEYHYGQVLHVSGIVHLSAGEKTTFSTMRYPEVTVTSDDSLLYRLIALIRGHVSTLYESTLPSDSASLLMGIVFGIKQGMNTEFKDALRETGVFHVVAASGMNVTLVAGAFMLFFSTFLKRQIALLFSIGGIFFYAVLAGLEPSILRASLMGGIVFLSAIIGRQHLALWTLAVTGYLMLLWNPKLITDVGFQLSFLATLGILLIKPVMYVSQKNEKVTNGNMVSEDFKTTLAAQLATMPILLSSFGTVSLLSLLVNVLVLWTIPPLMIIGSAAAIGAILFAPLGKLILFFSLPFLLYFEWVVMAFSRIKWSIQVESLPVYIIAGYYLLLICIVGWLERRRESGTS